MYNPSIPSHQSPEQEKAKPDRFWMLQRIGAAGLAVGALTMLGPRMYAEGAKMAESRGESYSVAEFWNDMAYRRMKPLPQDGQKIYERTFVAGEDGTWQLGEQGVNALLGAGVVAGAAVALKRNRRKDQEL